MATPGITIKIVRKRHVANKYNLLIYITILSYFLDVQTAWAEHEPTVAYVSEKDFFADMPTVLSASRLPQPQQDAPGAVTVIDHDTIAASGFTTVPDLLRLVPGMYVGYFKGHSPLAALHGLSGEFSSRMQVLVDGRSVYNSLIGSVEWNDIPLLLEDIERIEVVRGPNSAVFGANAFMGVINIVTHDPVKLNTSTARLNLGQDGQRLLSGQYVGHTSAWSYRLSAGYRADDGFDNINDGQQQKIINLRADYHPSGRDEWEFSAGYNDSRRDRGDVTSLYDQPHPENIHSSYVQAYWQRILAADREFSVRLYHNAYDLEGRVTTLPIPQLGNQTFNIGGTLDLQRTDLEGQFIFTPAQDWRTVVGVGVRRDSARSPIYLGRAEREVNDKARLFAHGEWHANSRLNVNLGAMLEDTAYTGRELSPRIALNYRLTPDHALRAGLSRASRTPTIYEEKGDYHFNLGPALIQQNKATGGLMSEHITSTELGYVGNFSQQGLTLDLRLYRDELKHLVAAQSIPFPAAVGGFTITAINRDQATIRGYESNLRYRPDSFTDITAAYANTRISSSDSDLERTMPVNTFSLLGSRKFGDQWQGSLGYYQISKVDPLSDGDLVPLQRRLDARMAYRFGAIQSIVKGGHAALVLQNLLGDYQDFNRNNLVKTRAYLSLDMEW
jgi:iron complex outermembrane recepter protein